MQRGGIDEVEKTVWRNFSINFVSLSDVLIAVHDNELC